MPSSSARRGEDLDWKRDVLRRPEPPTLPQLTPPPVLVKKEKTVWSTLWPYLAAIVVLLTVLTIIFQVVDSMTAFWAVLGGGLLLLVGVGIFQALNAEVLSEEGFLAALRELFKRVPGLPGNRAIE